jgi:hypothetical protein
MVLLPRSGVCSEGEERSGRQQEAVAWERTVTTLCTVGGSGKERGYEEKGISSSFLPDSLEATGTAALSMRGGKRVYWIQSLLPSYAYFVTVVLSSQGSQNQPVLRLKLKFQFLRTKIA